MKTYRVLIERTEVEEAWIAAESVEDAEELADIHYSDYTWSYVDGTMDTKILIGQTEEI